MFDKTLLKLDKGRSAIVVAFLFALLNSFLILGQCWGISSAIVDAWKGQILDLTTQNLGLFAICFIGRSLLKFLEGEYFESWAIRNVEDVRENLLERAWSLGNTIIENESSSSIAQLLGEGSESIIKYLSFALQKFAAIIVVPVVLALAILYEDWISGLIVIVCYPFIIVFMNLIGRSAAGEAKMRLDSFEKMSSQFIDSLRGLKTLKAFNVQEQFSKRIFASSELFRKRVMKTLRIASLSSAILDIFATGGLAAVAIMLGVRMVEGSMEFLPALFVLTLTPEFFLPVKRFADDYHSALDGRTFLHKAFDITQESNLVLNNGSYGPTLGADGPVKQGLTVLIGKSGSGKTTALQHYVNSLSKKSDNWQERIAYIPQRPHLIGDTVRDNVRFYYPSATDSQIDAALVAVDLSVDLNRLANTLSAGQKHRLMIARALLDPRRDTWILDEPSANLDYATDVELKKSLMKIKGSRTLVVTSHRLHWTYSADKVVSLDV